MTDWFMLSEAQMRGIEPFPLLSHDIARADVRRVISGIIFVIRKVLRLRDASANCRSHKTICKCFVRRSRLGDFNRTLVDLARKDAARNRIMIDAALLMAHGAFGRLKNHP